MGKGRMKMDGEGWGGMGRGGTGRVWKDRREETLPSEKNKSYKDFQRAKRKEGNFCSSREKNGVEEADD
jgi:hypothetical protein